MPLQTLLSRVFFKRNTCLICTGIHNRCYPRNPSITPQELLVQLHLLPSTNLKNIYGAIDFCCEKNADVFSAQTSTALNLSTSKLKKETVCRAVQQLSQIQPLPTLFMRTMYRTMHRVPSVIQFMFDKLGDAIHRKGLYLSFLPSITYLRSSFFWGGWLAKERVFLLSDFVDHSYYYFRKTQLIPTQ